MRGGALPLLLPLLAAVVPCAAACAKRRVLLWLPTRNKTAKHLAKYTEFLSRAEVRGAVTAVSVTAWQLADDPTGAAPLVPTSPHPIHFMDSLRPLGYEIYPTIYENWPAAGVLAPKLQRLFADPGGFFSQVKALTARHQVSGWNLDFEPKQSAGALRAGLTQFIGALGDELRGSGAGVSIDAAGCLGTFWDCAGLDAALSRATEGRVVTMATYARGAPDFDEGLRTLGALAAERVGVGFCPACWAHEGNPLSEAELRRRMAAVVAGGYCEVDLWQGAFPDMYNRYLRAFATNGTLPPQAADGPV